MENSGQLLGASFTQKAIQELLQINSPNYFIKSILFKKHFKSYSSESLRTAENFQA